MKLRFGDLTFDSDTRLILRGRNEVHVSPKAFELLALLIEARPRAVAKNELHGRLWPATFVSEANLASLIAEVRRALGDDARQPRFVRTAHRFGYAFCGDAEEAVTPFPADDAITPCWLLKDRRRLLLVVGENILGRGPDGIRLESRTVSHRHARITVSERGAVLEDLRSKNGTFLRGERVTSRRPLADGDEVRVGSVVLRFRTVPGSGTVTWNEPVDSTLLRSAPPGGRSARRNA